MNQKVKQIETKNAEIKQFIDFFHSASFKIRKEKPVFTKGKDGWLAKIALKKLSLSQLEQLSLWFLEKKRKLSATIGAMLSKKVLETLKKDMERSDFWKEINEIHDTYYKAPFFKKELARQFQPFTYKQINEIKEEAAALERKIKS